MAVRALPFLLIASLPSVSLGQPPSPPASPEEPPGTGVIVGQVIDPGTGRGVPGAIVTISAGVAGPSQLPPPSSTPLPQSMTTADGRFLFRDLRAGRYTINSTKSGYLTGSYGARRPGGGSAPIELEDGEHVTDIVVPVWKWGAITGTVVDEAAEPVVGLEVRALRRSIVSGRRQFVMGASATTDDRGTYRIAGLSPGDYVVAVVVAQTWYPSEVAETYRDAMNANDPNRNALMSAFMESGGFPPFPGSPTTLQIGSSVHSLRGPTPPQAADEARLFVYPTTFFPAARAIGEATVIPLRSGEERSGIDFDLKPIRTTRVSGSVIGPDGPAAHVALRLESGGDDVSQPEPDASTVTNAAGAFTFAAVTPGQYTLRVSRIPRGQPSGTPVTIVQSGSGMMISSVAGPAGPVSIPIPTDPTLWASMPVTVRQGPLSGLTINLQTGSRVRGRIEFEGTTERPDATAMQRIGIMFEPANGRMDFRSSPPARVEANGDFSTGGFIGGRYILRQPFAPGGWYLKEARYEGQDLSTTPINLEGKDLNGVTVVFTDRPTDLSGTVRSSQGAGDADATVLIFPVEEDAWQSAGSNTRRMRAVRASKTGSYKALGLPAGDYYVAAVPDEMVVDWQDPRVLGSLARDASRVSLDDGERKTQDLRTQSKR